MPKYIGATIGPITDTIMRARKTRSAWRASYMFSYLMKQIIIELRKYERIDLILPYSSNDEIYSKPQKAGLFHDRLIVEVKDNSFGLENLTKIKNDVFNDFIEKAIKNKISGSKQKFKEYLDTYINFYTVEKELQPNENIIFEMSKYLDVMELQPQICFKQFENNENYLFDFINDKKNYFLEKDAYVNEYEDKIKSLPEIAWLDIYNQMKKEDKNKIDDIIKNGENNPDYADDEEGYKYFKENAKEQFKKHHKYYAIVRADGDGIGAIINDFKEKDEYQKFSNLLFEFAKESADKIEKYGGLPIFAGGDDLLFFAPIINNSCADYKNIFELTTKLSYIFEEKVNLLMDEIEIKGKKATLSFGITMNYYKYPLYEAYGDSATELFEKAKEYDGKNATAVRLLKGSSKPIEFILNKSEKIEFQNFLNKFLFESKEKKLIKGVVYTLENQMAILECIQTDEVKLRNYFANSFKKEEHLDRSGDKPKLNDKLVSILEQCIAYGKEEKVKTLLKLLRFMMFLTEEGNDNE